MKIKYTEKEVKPQEFDKFNMPCDTVLTRSDIGAVYYKYIKVNDKIVCFSGSRIMIYEIEDIDEKLRFVEANVDITISN